MAVSFHQTTVGPIRSNDDIDQSPIMATAMVDTYQPHALEPQTFWTTTVDLLEQNVSSNEEALYWPQVKITDHSTDIMGGSYSSLAAIPSGIPHVDYAEFASIRSLNHSTETTSAPRPTPTTGCSLPLVGYGSPSSLACMHSLPEPIDSCQVQRRMIRSSSVPSPSKPRFIFNIDSEVRDHDFTRAHHTWMPYEQQERPESLDSQFVQQGIHGLGFPSQHLDGAQVHSRSLLDAWLSDTGAYAHDAQHMAAASHTQSRVIYEPSCNSTEQIHPSHGAACLTEHLSVPNSFPHAQSPFDAESVCYSSSSRFQTPAEDLHEPMRGRTMRVMTPDSHSYADVLCHEPPTIVMNSIERPENTPGNRNFTNDQSPAHLNPADWHGGWACSVASSYSPSPVPSNGPQGVSACRTLARRAVQKHRSRSVRSQSSRRSESQGRSGFVNYTPDDSSKLLSGVAPSGSLKTKARRDKAIVEMQKKFSQAAVRAVLEAGGDVSALTKAGVLV